MNQYPTAVTQIVDDYMQRLKAEIDMVPTRERGEILKELECHIYESYHATPVENDVARILAVLRNVGAPSEVVSGRLGPALVSTGTERSLPLYILGGGILAVCGVPLGMGGAALLLGALVVLVGVVFVYYAAAGTALAAALLFFSTGALQAYWPEVWDRLLNLGVIQMNGSVAEVLQSFSAREQGFMFIVLGSVFAGSGLALLYLGRHLTRGARFLFRLGLEASLRLFRDLRRRWPSAGFTATRELSFKRTGTR